MAIGSVFVNPPKMQPVYTNGLFYSATSNKTAEYKFRFVWDVYLNGEKVSRLKTTPNPNGIGVVDVSNVVSTYLETNVKVDSSFVSPVDIHNTFYFSKQNTDYNKPQVLDLYVLVGEEYATSANTATNIYNGYTDAVGEPSFSSDVSRTYNGTMVNNILYRNEDFNFFPYILQDTDNLFLTTAPRITDVSPNDYYTLSFANYNWYAGDQYLSYARAVQFDWYDSLGQHISTTTIPNVVDNGGGPYTSCTETEYSYLTRGITASTWNILNVGVGPKNTEAFRPTGTTYYTAKMVGTTSPSLTPPGQDNCGECAPPSGYSAATLRRCSDNQEFCANVDNATPLNAILNWSGYCFEVISIAGGSDLANCSWNLGPYSLYTGCTECMENETPACVPMSAVSETFSFNIDETCLRFDQKQFVWVNRYGTFDYYRFKAGKSEGVKIERQSYQHYNVNWGEASLTNPPKHLTSSRGTDVYNVSIKETHVVNSGFINYPDFYFLEGIYTSPNVYIIETDGTLNPVVITSTDYIRKIRGNTNLVNLELTYEYANNLKIN